VGGFLRTLAHGTVHSSDTGPLIAHVAALAQTGSEGFEPSTLWDEEKRRFAMM
jgi:hypothetical protein